MSTRAGWSSSTFVPGVGCSTRARCEVMGRLDSLAETTPSIFPEDEIAKAAKSSLTKASQGAQAEEDLR